MKLQIKMIGILVWLLALVSVAYAEPKPSDKLIGTWLQSNGACYIEITKDKIVPHELWVRLNPNCRVGSPKSWTDNKDGQTITVHDDVRDKPDYMGYHDAKDKPDYMEYYIVTDKYLDLGFSTYHSERYLFVKIERRSLAKLLGEWVIPQPDIDVSVTITYDKIIYKKGKLTEEREWNLGAESEKKFENYLFLDDTHVIVSTDYEDRSDGGYLPLPDNIQGFDNTVQVLLIKK